MECLNECSRCSNQCDSAESTPHLDNTLRMCFMECRRKFYLQHVLHIRSLFGSTALRYGSTWHAGMEAFYGHIQQHGWTRDGKAVEAAFAGMKREWDEISSKERFYLDYRTLENCFLSFTQYLAAFTADEGMLKVIATERPFKIHMELENKEEEKLFPGLQPFHFTGKVDMEIELNGMRWIDEHKTTGQAIDEQARRLNRSAQVMGYTYATVRRSEDRKTAPEGALITLHHLSCRKSTAKGREGEYGNPKIEFKRVPQIFNDNDIHQWRMSLLSTAFDIQRERERNLWPMNHDSCYNYGKCPYLSICESSNSIEKLRIDPDLYYYGEAWEVSRDVSDVTY